jgi:hypothetical protein
MKNTGYNDVASDKAIVGHNLTASYQSTDVVVVVATTLFGERSGEQ